jgi:DNA/RNA endonuclease YhcR with UshA esterase domain
MNKFSLFLAIVLVILLGHSACLKKEFDIPPDMSGYDPRLPVTHSIRQLKWFNGPYSYVTGGDTTVITQDITVCGIVTADDRSGNLYKRINIEDSTGGIQVAINQYSLYNQFPVGRKVYIKCKGLTLGYEGGTPVLGMGLNETLEVQGINGVAIDQHIIKGDVGHPVVPIEVSVAQLQPNTFDSMLLNRLITVPGVQFKIPLLPYAQPTGTTNRDLMDAQSGRTLTVRTSNFADFAPLPLPGGKGSVTGVFTLYTGTTGIKYTQLVVRDTSDVRMVNTAFPPAISIGELRNSFSGKGIKLGSVSIHGTVISDVANGNVATGNVVIQDGERGIVVYFGGAGSTPVLSVGDSVLIDVSGDSLTTYRNSMELKVLGGSAVQLVGSGRTVISRTMTTAEIVAKYSEVEWTLVRVQNATVMGGGTYAGSRTLTDATGTITLYTGPGSGFVGTAVPLSAKAFTGIANKFNTTLQLQMRNLADVK